MHHNSEGRRVILDNTRTEIGQTHPRERTRLTLQPITAHGSFDTNHAHKPQAPTSPT